jgi:hypothetical protein
MLSFKKLDFRLDVSDKPCSFAPLAQLDRASDYGSEGREFESSAARHLKLRPQHLIGAGAFLFWCLVLSGKPKSVQ